MVVVPAMAPYTIPDVSPTVPIDVLLLLQVPPEFASVSAVVDPAHTFIVPVITAGNVLTVTVVVVLHDVGNV